MSRGLKAGFAAAVAVVALALPAGAQARTPCSAEQISPTAANSDAVGDAIFCLTNQIRASYGLAPFRRDTRLDTAARLHSQDMATRDYFAHTNPEGQDPTARGAAQGYTTGVGENIASGYATARAVMLGWMASEGHCENILGTARDIGVGTFPTPRPFYTQDFGNYAFGPTSVVAAGCPYNVDLDSLVTPDLPAAVAAGPAAATASTPETSEAPAGTPVLGELGMARTRLRPGGRGLVTYTLSEAATMTLRFQRRTSGRWRTLRGSLKADSQEGTNTLMFRAALRGRTLSPGRYRLTAFATDDAGHDSPARRARFRVAGV